MWRIEYHPLVWREDLKRLDPSVQREVIRALEKKLSVDPRGYGRPLSGELARYWRLRVGDYRVVYEIIEAQVVVTVLKIGIRRDFELYREFLHRVQRLKFRG